MSRPLTIEREFHFERRERGRREVELGPASVVTPPGRVPRIARLMALAIRLERLLHEGVVSDYRALAELSHVTRARISQIVNLDCVPIKHVTLILIWHCKLLKNSRLRC
jgi:hypothetical protein